MLKCKKMNGNKLMAFFNNMENYQVLVTAITTHVKREFNLHREKSLPTVSRNSTNKYHPRARRTMKLLSRRTPLHPASAREAKHTLKKSTWVLLTVPVGSWAVTKRGGWEYETVQNYLVTACEEAEQSVYGLAVHASYTKQVLGCYTLFRLGDHTRHISPSCVAKKFTETFMEGSGKKHIYRSRYECYLFHTKEYTHLLMILWQQRRYEIS